jgi:AraC-like DNA-binding protein
MQTLSLHDLSGLATVSVLCGFDLEAVLKEAGIGVPERATADAPLDLRSLGRLFDLCRRRASKAYFPFAIGEHYAFDNVPEVQAFLMTCSSLSETLWLLQFLPNLVQPGLIARHRVRDERITIYFELHDDPAPTASPELIEAACVVVARFLTQVLQQQVRLDVGFQHQPMTAMDVYQKQFGARPSFGDADNFIRFEAALLDRPLQGGAPSLHARARLLLETRLQHQQVEQGVVRTLSQLLMQAPALGMTAASIRLGIEPRTLQRKLKEAQTSFAALQSQVRFTLAKAMLSERELDLDAIALKLGFADRASFSKAFSKWAGVPPATYRRTRLR